MNYIKLWKTLLIILVNFCAFLSLAAQPVVKTTIDKSEVLIGQQFKLKVQASFSGDDFFIKWVNIPDSFKHFELVNKSKIDSSFTNQRLCGLSQTFTLTSFDSGKWNLPSFDIVFNPLKGDSSKTFFTDSLPVTVSFSTADTTQALKDIKAIREVEVINPLWYWLGGLLILLLLILLGIWLYRHNKKNKINVNDKFKLSPYEEAMQELDKLTAFDLSVPKQTQLYHAKLIDIFRQYLSRKQNNNYLNKTTADIMMAINDAYHDKEILTNTATALRFSDAVKFSKYLPDANDSKSNRQLIKNIIQIIEPPSTNNKQ